MLRNFLLIGSLLITNHALGASAPTVNINRAVVIEGPISKNLGAVTEALTKWSLDGTGEAVDLILNSPGGSVYTGFFFLNALSDAKSRVQVRCFVVDMAASMAFQILTHCDERYSLNRSLLLWHRVRVSGGSALTAPMLKYLAWDLGKIDSLILKELYSTLTGMSRKEILYHFENESFHTGVTLASDVPKFVTSFPYIPGLYEALKSEKTPRSEALFLFGLFGATDSLTAPGTIYYMHESLMPMRGN